jgi:uncharacterized protein YecT (DUF1311 family)
VSLLIHICVLFFVGVSDAADKAKFSPHYDCAKASGRIEVAICSDSRLSESDRLLWKLYQSHVAEYPKPERKKKLGKKWKDWLEFCNHECPSPRSTELVQCLQSEYDNQFRFFKDMEHPQEALDRIQRENSVGSAIPKKP